MAIHSINEHITKLVRKGASEDTGLLNKHYHIREGTHVTTWLLDQKLLSLYSDRRIDEERRRDVHVNVGQTVTTNHI